MVQTYEDIVTYLSDKDSCDSKCVFAIKCPMYSKGSVINTCLIRRDATFDVFYNLFFDTKKGIDEEIKNALYDMAVDAITTGDKKDYLNNLVKVKTAFYGPDKDKEAQEIANVNIDIVPVSAGTVSEKQNETKTSKPRKKKNS